MSTSAVLSIFKTEMGKREFQAAYADCLDLWDIPYEIKVINTSFGDTHIIVSGGEDALPLVMLHGMTFNSTMWYKNVPSFIGTHRVFCVDSIGDYGKSVVSRPLKSRQDCAQWLEEVLNALSKAPYLPLSLFSLSTTI